MEITKTITLTEEQVNLVLQALSNEAWQARTYDYTKKDKLDFLIRQIETTPDDF